jgi:hypothetical protein
MNMHMLKRFAFVPLLLAFHACGGGSPSAPTPDFSGTWQGTFAMPSENPGTLSLDLTQTGLSIAGSGLITQNEFVDVPVTWTATLANPDASTSMQFVMTYAFGHPACFGQFQGTLDVSTHVIDGAFTGENCVRTFGGRLHAQRGQ